MLKTYRGSCHCGAVKFEADIDLTQNTYRCNCSICRRTRFWPAVAKADGFRLLAGEADLTQYLFNTRKNHHYFCKHCGVRAFGVGNETPIGKMYGINLGCLEDVSDEELARAPIVYVDGRNDPANPFRCPPGPYERASLIAHYLKTHKPRSKLILLDAKDAFSKQKLFEAAWKELYPGMIEWVALSFGGQVTRVEAATRTFVTEFGTHRADVANVIPPQRAGAVAGIAGVADQTGWCPVDPVTFESKLQPNVHAIGDAIIAGGMPKSAFSANAQARVCASAIVDLLRDRSPASPKLINTCYSLVAPDYGISIAGVYQPANGLLTDVPGAGGVSPLDAPKSVRAQEATYAEAWFKTITRGVFG